MGRKQSASHQQHVLYGRHAVLQALQNPNRHLQELLLTSENLNWLEGLSLELPTYKVVQKQELDSILPKESVHQGIVLKTKPLHQPNFNDLLKTFKNKDTCLLLILDQVTDPHNVGAILRSAAAFGADAVIVQDRHSPTESGVMAKAASGAMDAIPYVQVTNITRAIEQLQNQEVWCIGLDGEADLPLGHIDSPGKYAMVMGAEGDGLRRLTMEACDYCVKLPTTPPIQSLNVSNAAAITLYHVGNLLKIS